MRILVSLMMIVGSSSLFSQDFYQHSSDTYYSKETLFNNNLNLYMPVKFTPTGIESFLQYTFNNIHYAEVLANNFSHLTQFLEHGKQTKQQRAYVKSVLRLFCNKLKAAPYVNSAAFTELLEQLPPLLNEYFLIFKITELDAAKDSINELLYSSFLTHFSTFKESPHYFFNMISEQILDSLNNKYSIVDEVSADDLRKSMVLFLDTALNKLIWHPEEQFKTWESVKTIAHNLSLLMETNIISDPDDLNDLFVTLIERYCFFLDIVEADLPLDFYEKIKTDIVSGNHLFLEMEESEQFIEKKSQRLIQVLMNGQAKAQAREYGMRVKTRAA